MSQPRSDGQPDGQPDGIVPDDKDWTWVLDRPCPECGADVGSLDVHLIGDLVRANADSWRALLTSGRADLAVRSRPDRWSDLEYAAHVRDVHRLYLERLRMMLETDDPLYPNWDQDSSSSGYAAEDPAVVADELVVAAGALADAFDALSDEQWQRPGRRSDGASFTVATFARYLLHDPLHHLWDVTGTRGAPVA